MLNISYFIYQIPENKRKVVKKIIYIERLGKRPYNPSTAVFYPPVSVLAFELQIYGRPRQTDGAQPYVRVEFDEDMLKLVSLTILPNVVLSIRSLLRSLPMHLRSMASSRPSHGLWSRPHMESIQVHPSARLGT